MCSSQTLPELASGFKSQIWSETPPHWNVMNVSLKNLKEVLKKETTH